MTKNEKMQLLMEGQYLVGMLKDLTGCHGATEVRTKLESLIMETLNKLKGE